MKRTIIDLFEESTKNFTDNPYVFQKEGGAYKSYTYKEVNERTRMFAAGLMQLGAESW
jgi:long-chain acyl-CoA synthetase